PMNLETGMVDETVLAQWVAKSPHGLVRDPAFLARVKKDLSGRIMIIVGRKDDFDLFAPAESFARELDSLGVETRFVATCRGHCSRPPQSPLGTRADTPFPAPGARRGAIGSTSIATRACVLKAPFIVSVDAATPTRVDKAIGDRIDNRIASR